MNAAHATGDKNVKPHDLTTGGVLLQLADTTWRIAVPVLIFAGLGILADVRLGTKPWITLLAVVAGFFVAAVLVKRQIVAVEEADNR